MEHTITILGGIPAVPLIAGAALLLFGWVLYRAAITVTGGVLGLAAGYGLGLLAVRMLSLEPTPALITTAIVSAVGLIAGVMVFRLLHRMAFFITGAILGGWGFAEGFLALQASGSLEASDVAFAAGVVIAAVICGILMLLMSKYLVVIATSAVGTLLVMAALQWPNYSIIAAPGLFVLGMAIQLWVARVIKRREHED